MARPKNITIENARIFFKDFSASGPFAGGTKRTFCVELPEDMVPELERDDWNVKTRESRTDPDAVIHYLKAVSYTHLLGPDERLRKRTLLVKETHGFLPNLRAYHKEWKGGNLP